MGARSKKAREIEAACWSAGATDVRTTANGHLRVVGPKGICIVSSSFGERHAVLNAIKELRRHAGLDISGMVNP